MDDAVVVSRICAPPVRARLVVALEDGAMVASPFFTRSEIASLIGSARLAPSILNVQPWRFAVSRDTIELRLDQRTRLPGLDPRGRALVISCGAALLTLRLALAVARRRPDVELLPDPGEATCLARIRCGPPEAPTAEERRLLDAVPVRRSSRVPFTDEPVDGQLWKSLVLAARSEGATLRRVDQEQVAAVLRLVEAADRAHRASSVVRQELATWTRRGQGDARGLTDAVLGPTPLKPGAAVRDFVPGVDVPGRGQAMFERHPTIGMLLTPGDDEVNWLRGGQALQRVWLTATAAGSAMSLLTQPLEVAHLRWLARPQPSEVTAADPPWPQALFRIGRATADTPASPRLPVADLVTFVP